ncbi:MAG: sulfide:quinone oxidoreductase [Paraburkholderia sp.]|nr:sulfide:quinone oxidoreductase [Paraburkholderia sp.]
MDIKKLTAELAVSQQIAASDMRAIAQAGFRAVICNRPDGEGVDQPNFSEIEAAAREQGIEAHYLPIESGKAGDVDAARFGELIGHCRSPCWLIAAPGCVRRRCGRCLKQATGRCRTSSRQARPRVMICPR